MPGANALGIFFELSSVFIFSAFSDLFFLKMKQRGQTPMFHFSLFF